MPEAADAGRRVFAPLARVLRAVRPGLHAEAAALIAQPLALEDRPGAEDVPPSAPRPRASGGRRQTPQLGGLAAEVVRPVGLGDPWLAVVVAATAGCVPVPSSLGSGCAAGAGAASGTRGRLAAGRSAAAGGPLRRLLLPLVAPVAPGVGAGEVGLGDPVALAARRLGLRVELRHGGLARAEAAGAAAVGGAHGRARGPPGRPALWPHVMP
mmetsp:Transcript_27297/g.84820  ORF Transcript_27297/g.84820 Transcript_27297/m.84820 type:complete len:211 (+) Transcript_27297:667-1299(+)